MCENERCIYVKAFESYGIKGGECVLVTRGHFRSRDKDGGHTIRSAVFKQVAQLSQRDRAAGWVSNG